MSLSSPFIRRPVATLLLSLALFLAGGVAYFQLPISSLPKVEFPTLSVSGALPGASAETMAARVAAPLERHFGRIAGLMELTSNSALGTTNVTLQFELDRGLDAAARDVQAAINAAVPELPDTMPARPRIGKLNPPDMPVLVLSLTSATIPIEQMFDTASSVLSQKLLRLAGVGQVFIGGGQMPAVRIQADPEKLAQLGLGLADVREMLTQESLNQPKGALSGSELGPAATVNANDQLRRASDFEQLVIAYDKGAPVRLRDVARVLDDVENRRVTAWFDHQRALLLFIRRQPDANVIEVVDRIKALLPELTQSVSPALRLEVVLDRSQTIRASVHDVELTLLLSLGLVVSVVFVFLRDVRATLVPSVAVPLSIVGTFVGMHFLGYSLDNLSLMALTISTGFVVDDAIVVTENISRGLERGASPREAALEGARKIGFTVLSITASLLAVFLPIFLMQGVPGRLCREFVVTLSIAVTLSAVISLTLTPMMCAYLLRAPDQTRKGLITRALERFFSGLERGYERGLRFCLRHRLALLFLTLASIGGSIYLYILIPKGLFPQQDTSQLLGFVEVAQDVSFDAMRKAGLRADQIISADPDVQHYMSFVGSGQGASANVSLVFVALKPRQLRKATAADVIARIRQKTAKLPGISVMLQADQDIRIGARFAKAQFQYTLQAVELAELNTWAPRVLERLRAQKELKDVSSDQQMAGLGLDLAIDRDMASRLGVTLTEIDDALYDAFGQRQIAVLYGPSNQYRVVLEVLPEFQASPDGLDHLYVRSSSGKAVALHSLLQRKTVLTPLSINHQGQFPSVTVSFNVAPGLTLGDAITAVKRVEQELRLPSGVRTSFQGAAQAFGASLSNMPLLILAALVSIYLVLGILYESYVHPLTILSTIPSAGVGALLALLICKIELNVIALIGIILLIGIVKKNAIMMIDFALEAERDDGMTPMEAISQACVVRFRPILMTTMAALFGALPLMLGDGPGSELRRPLGIAIVGGLIVSQLLTLFTTPVIYLSLARWNWSGGDGEDESRWRLPQD